MTAQQYSKGMAHERMRFASMNGSQLITRLNRITKIDKLELFILLAREYQYDRLVNLATNKLNILRGLHGMTPQTVVWPKEIDPTVTETMIIKEVELKRPRRKFNFD